MKMSETELSTFIDIWLALKPHITAKERDSACEKYLEIINENLHDLSEVGDEWFGYDTTIDKMLKETFYSEPTGGDYEQDEDDNW